MSEPIVTGYYVVKITGQELPEPEDVQDWVFDQVGNDNTTVSVELEDTEFGNI